MPALTTDQVTVAYRGLLALSEVSLELEQGKITGLIGPNGAGKSTMIGVLSGLVRPRSGHVLLDGRDVTRLPPHRRARLGMARTFQRLELWRSMTVEENILTAAEFAASWQHGWDARAATREAIELLGLADVAQQDVTELSSGHGRLVEVARAVAPRPKVLLLDEPSAGLNEAESRTLGETLAQFLGHDDHAGRAPHRTRLFHLRLCLRAGVRAADRGGHARRGPVQRSRPGGLPRPEAQCP
jgi:branched-chain amino acid transport system ATP-binding protein